MIIVAGLNEFDFTTCAEVSLRAVTIKEQYKASPKWQKVTAMISAVAAVIGIAMIFVPMLQTDVEAAVTKSESAVVHQNIIDTHTRDKATSEEREKNKTVRDLEAQIADWQWKLRTESLSEPDREWIRGQITRLTNELTCVRANNC